MHALTGVAASCLLNIMGSWFSRKRCHEHMVARPSTMAYHQPCTLVWWISPGTSPTGFLECISNIILQPKEKPASLTHLQALLHMLRLTNMFDAAVFTIACVAFWGQCWLAEVIMDGPPQNMHHALPIFLMVSPPQTLDTVVSE